MTALTLSLAEQDLDTPLASGVVARIYGFSVEAGDAEADVAPSVKEVVIPATRSEGLTVPVEAGHYRVQALLPTGKILQRTATVKDGETVQVVFDAGEATRSWLGWQSEASEASEVTPKWIGSRQADQFGWNEDPGIDAVLVQLDDPANVQTMRQYCESFLQKTKLPIWRSTPLYRLASLTGVGSKKWKVLPEAYAMRGAVNAFSRALDAGVDFAPGVRVAYPKLLNAFQRFDYAVADMSTDDSWMTPKSLARTVFDATLPLCNALGFVWTAPQARTIDREFTSVHGTNVQPLEIAVRTPPNLTVLQQPRELAGELAWHAFQHGADGADVMRLLSLGWDPQVLPALETLRGPEQRQRWLLRREAELDDVRRWLMLRTAQDTEFGVFPLPWFDPRTSTFVSAEAMVNETVGKTPGSALQITLRDPTLGGLLAYLEHGNLSAARPMVDVLDSEGLITRTIADKVKNPLAACVAAYVGLAIFEPEERERWDTWLPNIAQMFPWIPDGPIVHARRILNRPHIADETAQVLPALKDAYRRGIPFFSAGVHHLRDMLSLYSSVDPEVKVMLETVSGVLSRVDRYQALTVIRFPAAKTH